MLAHYDLHIEPCSQLSYLSPYHRVTHKDFSNVHFTTMAANFNCWHIPCVWKLNDWAHFRGRRSFCLLEYYLTLQRSIFTILYSNAGVPALPIGPIIIWRACSPWQLQNSWETNCKQYLHFEHPCTQGV